jgi:hypothetical protein
MLGGTPGANSLATYESLEGILYTARLPWPNIPTPFLEMKYYAALQKAHKRCDTNVEELKYSNH